MDTAAGCKWKQWMHASTGICITEVTHNQKDPKEWFYSISWCFFWSDGERRPQDGQNRNAPVLSRRNLVRDARRRRNGTNTGYVYKDNTTTQGFIKCFLWCGEKVKVSTSFLLQMWAWNLMSSLARFRTVESFSSTTWSPTEGLPFQPFAFPLSRLFLSLQLCFMKLRIFPQFEQPVERYEVEFGFEVAKSWPARGILRPKTRRSPAKFRKPEPPYRLGHLQWDWPQQSKWRISSCGKCSRTQKQIYHCCSCGLLLYENWVSVRSIVFPQWRNNACWYATQSWWDYQICVQNLNIQRTIKTNFNCRKLRSLTLQCLGLGWRSGKLFMWMSTQGSWKVKSRVIHSHCSLPDSATQSGN